MGWTKSWLGTGCYLALGWSLALASACGGRSELRLGAEPKPEACGNGVLDQGEQCDDGNQLDGDGCTSTCERSACGNNVVDVGEGCDLGAGNFDLWAFEVLQGDNVYRVRPLLTQSDVLQTYNYFSFSSHTGLEALEASRIFLHADYPGNQLSLVLHHGVDFDTAGVSQPLAELIFRFSGLPESTFVAISDDNNSPETTELFKETPTTAIGDWRFEVNSDGGVITNFGFPEDWSVTLEPEFIQGMKVWEWFDGDGLLSLDMSQPITIVAHGNPSPCNTKCQIPRCGDDFLDPGELCDGPGCDSDCRSIAQP